MVIGRDSMDFKVNSVSLLSRSALLDVRAMSVTLAIPTCQFATEKSTRVSIWLNVIALALAWIRVWSVKSGVRRPSA